MADFQSTLILLFLVVFLDCLTELNETLLNILGGVYDVSFESNLHFDPYGSLAEILWSKNSNANPCIVDGNKKKLSQ